MSISTTLSNALSGLTIASRSADIVSSNIANAATEGYGVRSLDVSARVTGGQGSGARITGVTRQEDPVLIANRRHADADLGFQETRGSYLQRMETLVGTPDQPGSLTARVAQMEAAFVAAANAPHSQAHLTTAVTSAQAVSTAVNRIADGVQAERKQADAQIGEAVTLINDRLQQLADLNNHLRQSATSSRDTSALLDMQSKLLNDLSPYLTLQTRRDRLGALQIYSQDGRPLLDGRPAVLSFEASGVMDPFLTAPSSGLSGLQFNGRDLPMTGPNAMLSGGKLSALFELRDVWGIDAQSQIDGVARDLAERFGGTTLDRTLSAGAPGLFTDAGSLATPINELGLAQRLSVNAAVVPSEGGAVWRLRDGLGATAEGAAGQSAFLLRQIDAMAALRPTASGGFSTAARSLSALASEHITGIGFARHSADTDKAHAISQQTLFSEAELALGVDTDAEMQKLLQIEQAYSANARVVTAAQEMLDELMRMI